jgi:hypothetical protein
MVVRDQRASGIKSAVERAMYRKAAEAMKLRCDSARPI